LQARAFPHTLAPLELREYPFVKPRHKRLAIIVGGLAALGVAAALVLNAFQSNLVFFYSPSQILANEAPQGKTLRIGGMVEEGSLKRESDGLTVRFLVTDTAKAVPVVYKGILPDLFKEGKGVVAQGRLDADGVFRASEVLAKHDENYMPPEAAHAMEQAQKAQKTLKGSP
jgi:cytochrome c-type biogenesis protein CcmE